MAKFVITVNAEKTFVYTGIKDDVTIFKKYQTFNHDGKMYSFWNHVCIEDTFFIFFLPSARADKL